MLLILLVNLRAGLVLASVIPLAMMFAFIGMWITGTSANLMSLGAIDFGLVVDGSLIIVENVFAYPGIGQLMLWSINTRDVPLLEAVALILAMTYAVSNLIADLSYAALDPRVRLE